MFEVPNLKFVTLATVGCCGIVWFGEDVFIQREEEVRGGGGFSHQETLSPVMYMYVGLCFI